jgi:septal ring factor EnvC (AmiA/AmiB activator)
MNAKIVKINAEIDKTKARIAEFQARLRELERQRTEAENTEIVELVRGVDATPQELAAFIRAFREQSGTPSLFQQKQEEKEHE